MRRLIALAVLSAGLVLAGGAQMPAWADECDGPVTPGGICLGGGTPGTPGTETPGNGVSSGGGCRDASGASIPCVNDYGYVWLGSQNCYGFMLDPQPEAGNPIWDGHDPSEGSIWSCDPTVSVPGNTWFVPGAAPVIDAASVAEDIVKRAPFETANASIAPPPSYHTYVNYKNWMWIPEDQWHDVSVSVNAGGARVTLTATPTRVEWGMGNGDVQFCPGRGREWVEGMPENAPTSCSYTYTDMENPRGDRWPVSARLVYSVRWTCAGRCSSPDGDLGEHTALAGATTTIEVLQRQTVVIR
jgi:hypothetical protein